MLEKYCKNCRWWDQSTEDNYGHCRFNPPMAATLGGWSTSRESDWCSKFDLRSDLYENPPPPQSGSG